MRRHVKSRHSRVRRRCCSVTCSQATPRQDEVQCRRVTARLRIAPYVEAEPRHGSVGPSLPQQCQGKARYGTACLCIGTVLWSISAYGVAEVWYRYASYALPGHVHDTRGVPVCWHGTSGSSQVSTCDGPGLLRKVMALTGFVMPGNGLDMTRFAAWRLVRV